MYDAERHRKNILDKFEMLSLKHHKISILLHELKQSLRIEFKTKGLYTPKKLKEHLKTLNLDFDKIMALSMSLKDITLNDLKGGQKK